MFWSNSSLEFTVQFVQAVLIWRFVTEFSFDSGLFHMNMTINSLSVNPS